MNAHERCWCHRCVSEENNAAKRIFGVDGFYPTSMIVCPNCGNKRCPRATSHENKCTNSNEPGQRGSIYR